MQVVWFKRDLRTVDHAALVRAVNAQATMGQVLPLYIFEPKLWQQPDMSQRHYAFLYESLESLHHQLQKLGCALVVKVGNAVSVLQALHNKYQLTAVWSHQETWNGWTFKRDLAVKKWTKQQNIIWYEPLQYGVLRRIDRVKGKNNTYGRDGWTKHWHDIIDSEPLPAPSTLQPVNEPSDVLATPRLANLSAIFRLTSAKQPLYSPLLSHITHQTSIALAAKDNCDTTFAIHPKLRQCGGRENGLATLHSFLSHRGEGYTKQISSPVTAFDSCSRISPHLAFGTLSMREVFKAHQHKKQSIDNRPKHLQGYWGSAMKSFAARLRWHCHFMQKLETQPSIEFVNLHPVYDGMREPEFNEAYFKAWQTGHTGYPMVDACMRALIATGWLNFRMRAMLMSFASHHLWLHWQRTALHLARLFVDYEPGIHYSQVQMQSGTTGINSIRVYNPIKQGIDQDPEGIFIRRWVPELANLPNEFIHTPWRCAEDLMLGMSAMNGYPMPIVEEKLARKSATDKLAAIRKHMRTNATHQSTHNKIIQTHASRKNKSNQHKRNQSKHKSSQKIGQSSSQKPNQKHPAQNQTSNEQLGFIFE